MKNLILFKKGNLSFILYIKKRLKNNLNFIALFSGSSGIGKTFAGLRTLYELDPTFDPEKQITFSFRETLNLANSEWFKKKKIKTILWDEPQVDISNRTWQSLTNKMMNYFLSTFRHQNIVLIFCCPYKDFLDASSMKMLHCIFECQGVNRKKELSLVKPLLQQYNPAYKKFYQHPLYVIKNKKAIPLRQWFIPKPPQHLIDVFERRKSEFTAQLNKDIERELSKISEDKDPIKRKPFTEKQKKVMELLVKYPAEEVAKILHITPNMINTHRRASEKKGWKVEDFKKS